MHLWRITKYDPKNRDPVRGYLLDEWTEYREIGKGETFDGEILTYEEYLKAENAYVAAIILIMESNNIATFKVIDLFKGRLAKLKDKNLSKELKGTFKLVMDNEFVNKKTVENLSRLILRDKLHCKFEATGMFVHFGWDYYMYIGSFNKCEKTVKKIHKLGLFVEDFESPYLDEEE